MRLEIVSKSIVALDAYVNLKHKFLSQNSAFISNTAFELYQSRLVTINEKPVNGNDLENLRICDNRKNPISLEPNKLLGSNKKTLHEFYLKTSCKSSFAE